MPFASLLLIILERIFYFQSKSILGPKRSFMYKNPNWTKWIYCNPFRNSSASNIFFTFKKEKNYRYKRNVEFNKQIYL